MYRRFSKRNNSTRKGFTIAEMAIVSIIFTILTAVIIFRYGDFNSSLLVSNMAYEVAITTRQAQVFGLGARGYQGADGANFTYPYGLFINMNDNEGTTLGRTKKFNLFIDRENFSESDEGICNLKDGGGVCVCLPGDECQEQYTMQRNIAISGIRVRAGNLDLCEADKVDKLAITFKRPNPEALITWQTYGSTFDFAQIEVSDDKEEYKTYVLIRSTGQISVSKEDICSNFYDDIDGGDSN